MVGGAQGARCRNPASVGSPEVRYIAAVPRLGRGRFLGHEDYGTPVLQGVKDDGV